MLEASDMKAIRRQSLALDGSMPSISETESPTTCSGGTRLSLGTQNDDSGISVDSSMNRGIRGGLRPCIVAEEPDDDDIFGNMTYDTVQAQTPEEESNVYTNLHGSQVPLKFGDESPQKPSLTDKSGLSASLPSCLSSRAGARHHREVSGSRSLSASGSCLKRANSENKKQIKRSISFSNLQVREYDLTIGDNPSVSYGPPVQLSWQYSEHNARSLEEYENEKQLDLSRGRRNSRVENISWVKREALLKRQGFSQDDIDTRMKEVNKVKQGRSVTRALVVTGRTEEALESAGRKLKRFFGGGGNPESKDRQTISPRRPITNDSAIGDRASIQ